MCYYSYWIWIELNMIHIHIQYISDCWYCWIKIYQPLVVFYLFHLLFIFKCIFRDEVWLRCPGWTRTPGLEWSSHLSLLSSWQMAPLPASVPFGFGPPFWVKCLKFHFTSSINLLFILKKIFKLFSWSFQYIFLST